MLTPGRRRKASAGKQRMDPTHLFELVIAMFLAIIALHYAAQKLGLPPSAGLIVGARCWPLSRACAQSPLIPGWCW